MTEGDDPSHRFLPRIRQELDKLPLTEDQKSEVAPKILRHAAFLDTDGFADKSGALKPDSAFFGFAGKINDLVQRFREDGLTVPAFLQAALQQPALFGRAPETIAAHITGLVDRFAVDGLTQKAYLNAALKQPTLFAKSPETTASNIMRMVDRFASDGLTRRAYLSAALKQPRLFGQSPNTIASHITGVVDRFAAEGLTRRAYLNAVLKQPTLFTQSPETIARNITSVVDRFAADGLTLKSYLQAAVKQPTLFYQSPETISRHIDTIIDFYDRELFRPPPSRSKQGSSSAYRSHHAEVIDFILANPALMCLADDNYGLREVHQRLTDGSTDAKLLERPRYVVEREIMAHLGHNDARRPVEAGGFVAGAAPPTEEQARRFVLRALIHAGFIRGGSMER